MDSADLSALEQKLENHRAWVNASRVGYAIATWDRITLVAQNSGNVRTGPNRRGRAAEINTLKRAIEGITGYELVLTSKSYSETWGFLHESSFTYAVNRTAK